MSNGLQEGDGSFAPTTFGPQNHEKWRFLALNIWVIPSKNEGFGFPWQLITYYITSLGRGYKGHDVDLNAAWRGTIRFVGMKSWCKVWHTSPCNEPFSQELGCIIFLYTANNPQITMVLVTAHSNTSKKNEGNWSFEHCSLAYCQSQKKMIGSVVVQSLMF